MINVADRDDVFGAQFLGILTPHSTGTHDRDI
jgi:hypothetical protein